MAGRLTTKKNSVKLGKPSTGADAKKKKEKNSARSADAASILIDRRRLCGASNIEERFAISIVVSVTGINIESRL